MFLFFFALITFPSISSLNKIEAIYGGSYASLFEMIRWLFMFNLCIGFLITIFIVLPQFVYDLDKTQFDLMAAGFDTYDLDSCRNSSDYINNNNETSSLVLSEYNETIKLTICCSLLYDKSIQDTVENVTMFDRVMFAIQGTVNKN